MVSDSQLLVIIIVISASTLANNVQSASVYASVENYTNLRLDDVPKIMRTNASINEDDEDGQRDKRALGVILQGLVEALGYTASPISLASLPNPNTTSPAPPRPPQKPQTAASSPGPATMMTPRQRETLRFTGVVNFGNNSDLLGHLRQYERIFHGNASTTAAPASGPPPARPTRPSLGKPALLTPYFVPIPLPLAPNLPAPLPASAPRKVKDMEYSYTKQENNESYESQEISDEKDVRKNPPHRESDTYIDEPQWKIKQREENERNKHKEENYKEDNSEEEVEKPNKYHQEKIVDQGREDEGYSKKKPEESREENESVEEDTAEDDKKDSYKEDEENREDSREEEGYTKNKEESREDGDGRENSSGEYVSEDDNTNGKNKKSYEASREPISERNNAKNEDYTTVRSNFEGYEDPFDFSSRKIPPPPKQFGNRLPIRVFDDPYSLRGGLRNSYGESLEQGGRIDESVADYFQRYKDPETGLFDSRKIQSLQRSKERDPWWDGHQGSVPGVDGDPLERIRQEYAPPANARYEEYSVEDNDHEKHKSRKEDSEDEKVEPTEAEYRSTKGRDKEKGSRNEDEEYGERVEATKAKYSQTNGRDNEKRNESRNDDKEYNGKVQQTETKYRQGKGQIKEKGSRNEHEEYGGRVVQPETKYRQGKGRNEEKRSRNEDEEYGGRAEPTKTTYRITNEQDKTKVSRKQDEEYGGTVEQLEAIYKQGKGRNKENGSRKEDEEYGGRAEPTKITYRTTNGQDKAKASRKQDEEYGGRVEPMEAKYRQAKSRNEPKLSKSEVEGYTKRVYPTMEIYRSTKRPDEATVSRNENREYDSRVEPTHATYKSTKGPLEKTGVTKNGDEENGERVEPTKTTHRQAKRPHKTKIFKNNYEDYAERFSPTEVKPSQFEPRDKLKVSRDEDEEYSRRIPPTETKYKPEKRRESARISNNKEKEETLHTSTPYGRTEFPEKESTFRDEDAEDEKAEPMVKTYTNINALEGTRSSNANDRSDESDESEQSSVLSRVEVPENSGSVEDTKGMSKFEGFAIRNPMPFKGFDFIKYSPYFRPIRVTYDREKLQRTADRILSNHKSNEDTNEDEMRSLELPMDINNDGPAKILNGVDSDESITRNPYLRPVQLVYEPEKLQRTANRILSYQNPVGSNKSRERANNEEIRNEAKKTEEEEDDRTAVENSDENNDSSQNYEQEEHRSVNDSNENQNDYRGQNYEEQNDRSEESSNETNGSSQNYEEQEDRSPGQRNKENYVQPTVGLPERLTGKKLHEGESKEVRAWPAPFDHTFDSTERAKVVRLPNSKVATTIRDEDVEPTYETPAVLEVSSSITTQNYPRDAHVTPTYETRSIDESRSSRLTKDYPRDSYVSPTNESPIEKPRDSETPVSRPNNRIRTRPQSSSTKRSGDKDNGKKRRKRPRVTTSKAENRTTAELSRYKHREESEIAKSRNGNSSSRLQISEPRGFEDSFEAKQYRPEELRNIEIMKKYNRKNDSRVDKASGKPSAQPRKFEGLESAHDFFGLSKNDYILEDDNKTPIIDGHAQTTTTPSSKELHGLLIIPQDPNYERNVALTEFTDEPETETEQVKVNEYRNKVATLKVSERKQSSPNGPVLRVGYTRSF